jgi:hypothetical protein
MMLLLTPIISEVVQAKTSVFFSKDNNSVSSSNERSCTINTVQFDTLGSSVTHFVSHSASIVVLASLGASAFAFLNILLITTRCFSQEVDILVAWSKTLLDVSGFYLTAKN